ncbi:MAG TPA: hypothetical protein PLW66_10985 [Saprospiraceae bacterium]|nr:hypothetical protein [Saprospiraceae bacterium]
MMFRLIRYLGALLLMLLTGWACGPDTETIVQTKVAERVGEFRAKRQAECQLRLLTRAEKMADSLLIQEAIDDLNDSLARSRPGRPDRPAAVPPIDSSSVKPLFEQ